MHLFLAFMLYFFGVMFWVGMYRGSGNSDEKASYPQFAFAIILNPRSAHVVGLIPVIILAVFLKEWWLFPAVVVIDIILSHMWWFMWVKKNG